MMDAYFGGGWIFAFKMKMLLAVLLVVFPLAGIFAARREELPGKALTAIYLGCFLMVGGLGYFGGEIVFAGKGAQESLQQAGARLYASNCAGCHPRGGNVMNAGKPVKGSGKLTDFDTFLTSIRSPDALMRTFPESAMSRRHAAELYDYVNHAMK